MIRLKRSSIFPPICGILLYGKKVNKAVNEQLLALHRMQDYIDAHDSEDISLSELAGAAMYSPWYARRLFIRWLGITPADYIRRLRLSKSALQLRDDGITVTDAALSMGLSLDGYRKAFFREFGCNPGDYARCPVPIPLFKPYKMLDPDREKEEHPMETKNVFIQIVEKPERKLILKRGIKATHYFDYCEEVGCDVWGLLTSIRSLDGEPVCLWLPEKFRLPGTSEYVQGAEVPLDYNGPIPDGFDVITLPAATYLKFTGEPFADEDFEDAIRNIWEAELKFNPASIGYRWDDENPKIQLEPIGSRGYIELKPIVKL